MAFPMKIRVKHVIRDKKQVLDYGSWSRGHIDRSSWPLRKQKLKFSSDWEWRVVVMKSSVGELRVLLRLNPCTEQFYAVLGHVRGDQLAVLCSHELHTSHANWHCHVATGPVSDVMIGVNRD